jgi:hypothetical protein
VSRRIFTSIALALALPEDHQIKRAAAKPVLALHALAAVDDALQERHEHQVRPCLAVAEALGGEVPVLAPERLPRGHELGHVERAGARTTPSADAG